MSSGPGSDTDHYAEKFGRTIQGRLRFDESKAFALTGKGEEVAQNFVG